MLLRLAYSSAFLTASAFSIYKHHVLFGTLIHLAPMEIRMPDVSRNQSDGHDGSVSPQAPPYSPITPTFRTATLAPHPTACKQVPIPAMDPSAALLPVSEADDSDAIALRSAISILQIQRQQSLRDLKTLEKQKHAAVEDPGEFTKHVVSGRLQTSSTARLPGQIRSPYKPSAQYESISGNSESAANPMAFGDIPSPQNIVRCPPINWAKYHVVGEALDKLHEEQRLRPTSGEVRRDVEPSRSLEHVIAAPYRPWVDKLPESSMRTRSNTKGEPNHKSTNTQAANK